MRFYRISRGMAGAGGLHRETMDVPDAANCIYVRHPYVMNIVMMNTDIWNAHFKTMYGNPEKVIVYGQSITIDEGGVYVHLQPDGEWRPGNFIINIVSPTGTPNETSEVKEKLRAFFEKFERERICPPRIRAAGTAADPIVLNESPIAHAGNAVNIVVGGRKRGRRSGRKTQRGRGRKGRKTHKKSGPRRSRG